MSQLPVAARVVIALMVLLLAGAAHAATVVCLGASNTYGKGVARSESYPAQLQGILRAKGSKATIVNAGINGNTTGQMLARLDSTLAGDTKIVLLQPGGNDRRKGQGADRESNIAAIQQRLAGRGIKVIMVENNMLRGKPHQSDNQHLTPDGYRQLAEELAPQVAAALGK